MPATPDTVRVEASGGRLTVTWQPPQAGAHAARYLVTFFRDGSEVTHVHVRSARPHTANWAGLAAGHQYSVTVQAGNAAGYGPAAQSATVTPTAPGEVTGVLATGKLPTTPGGAARLTLSFAAPQADGGLPITGYHVALYRDGDAAAPVLSQDVTGPTLVSEAVKAGQSYHYVVSAGNAAGDGPTVHSDHVVLVAPTHVEVSAGSAGSTVTWAAPAAGPAVTGYLLSVLDKSGNPAAQPVSITGADTRTYSLHDLTGAGPYIAEVSAIYGPDSRSAVARSAPFSAP